VTRLRDHDWKLKYTEDDGDLVDLFYVPALSSAVRYDRLTGYFSASILAVAARGVEGLIANGGRMRMVAGCTLGEAEVQAIEHGLSLRQAVERAMPELGDTPDISDALELMAWMVANDRLDIKIAVRCDRDRKPVVATTAIFHEKSGIVADGEGDEIAFTGSVNETAQGWLANWESFHVFTSWTDAPRVRHESENFAKIWADRAERYVTVDVPTAVRDQLLTFAPEEGELPARFQRLRRPVGRPEPEVAPEPLAVPRVSIDERRRAIWRKIATAAREPVGGDRVGEATSAITPWPHQVRAFHRMYDRWPPKLLIADEVGLGKTIQAGLLLRQAWLAGRIERALILAPKSVCRQWQIELREKFNLDWPLYDGRKLTWLASPARPNGRELVVGRDAWHREPFVIMSSHLARRRDRQAELLEHADPWDLVVLDEAHHARRKAAGSPQEGGPNTLLSLMRRLRERTDGLVLLTATPLQVHPVELWDLLWLLDLPDAWSADAFVGFFRDLASPEVTHDKIDRLAKLFRASEAAFEELDRDEVVRLTGLSRLQAKKVLDGLRDHRSSLLRRQFSEGQRKAVVKLVRRASPVKALVSRHTRELLREYHRAGKLETPIADREVEDRFIQLSDLEREAYRAVERYISTTYNAAAAGERNAVGFVMTIYRRRLASSFFALRATLEGRLANIGAPMIAEQDLGLEEDIADAVEEGEDIDAEEARRESEAALQLEERTSIDRLIGRIAALPTDTKAEHLIEEIDHLRARGYPQVIVFTQFTDTMDFLRDVLSERTAHRLMCYSGRGGEVRSANGSWTIARREVVKRRFRDGDADVLLCTDAAAEGLNFQFCGALVNYDMPWNPMRVEQRIGRIDRLGQSFGKIRIINLHYADTVEADVYSALRNRISVFERVVGGLQPILSRLPELIGSAVLKGHDGLAQSDALADEVGRQVDSVAADAVDIDDLSDAALEVPERPAPALTLDDLRLVLEQPDLLLPGLDAERYGRHEFRFASGDLNDAVRVTVEASFYDEQSDSVEFWTPGNPAFPDVHAFGETNAPEPVSANSE